MPSTVDQAGHVATTAPGGRSLLISDHSLERNQFQKAFSAIEAQLTLESTCTDDPWDSETFAA
jgi:hypothetical protein